MTKQAALDWFKSLPEAEQVAFLEKAAYELSGYIGFDLVEDGLDRIRREIVTEPDAPVSAESAFLAHGGFL